MCERGGGGGGGGETEREGGRERDGGKERERVGRDGERERYLVQLLAVNTVYTYIRLYLSLRKCLVKS